jgi:hypothetical protein
MKKICINRSYSTKYEMLESYKDDLVTKVNEIKSKRPEIRLFVFLNKQSRISDLDSILF